MTERGSGRSGRGYTLVALMVAMTVMTILIAAVLPLASTQAQRDREAELIFRGTQIAEGIRTFRRRYGRYPTSLKEMLDTKPRTLRKLWKDPMTPSGEWDLISLDATPVRRLPTGLPGATPAATPTPSPTAAPTPERGGLPRLGDRPPGPIMGVHSFSKKKGLRLFGGRSNYDEWRFTEQTLGTGRDGESGAQGGGAPGPGISDDNPRPPGGGGGLIPGK